MIRTYSQPIQANDLIFNMAHESAEVYNKAIDLHADGIEFSEIGKIIDKEFFNEFLMAQSRQASYQQYVKDFRAYCASLKAYKINPTKFLSEPKPPRKKKYLKPIYFKQDAIRYKDGKLFLTAKRPNLPIIVKWNDVLPIPQFATIIYDFKTGWNLNLIIETKDEELKIQNKENLKVMAVDLGVKRTATTFDGTNTVTYSGKMLLSLNHLRNKLYAKTQEKLSKCNKNSRREKYLKRAFRKNCMKIKNKQKDILHKYSRCICNDAENKKIDVIVFGDCSSTHYKTNTGRKNNQKINQNPEQKLRKYVEYKWQSAGKITKVRSERRTSKTCPKCKMVKKTSPKGRVFKCNDKKCRFVFDRDGVGSINIYSLEVSFSHCEWLNVVGRLTRPSGVKYAPDLSFKRVVHSQS